MLVAEKMSTIKVSKKLTLQTKCCCGNDTNTAWVAAASTKGTLTEKRLSWNVFGKKPP